MIVILSCLIIIIFEKVINEKAFDPGKGYFLSANTQYQKLNIENFKHCIKDLDESTQNMINNILIQLSKNSPLDME